MRLARVGNAICRRCLLATAALEALGTPEAIMPNWDRKRKKHLFDALRVADLRQRGRVFFDRLAIPRETLEGAIRGLLGRIVLPGDPEYEKDRKLWNPVFDSHPAMIVYCLTESDVRFCLYLGRLSGMAIAVRAGGHSTAGYSSGDGILVDVSGLNDVVFDPDKLILTAGAGATCGKVASVLDLNNAHVPYSECDSVCFGGYVQGGGFAFSSRTFGMCSDNAVRMRVMLADGSIVTASEDTNYDLWWALRGGTGNNFGVLLSAEFAAQTIAPVYGWMIHWPLATEDDRENAAAALELMQSEYFLTAPAQFNIQVSIFYRKIADGSVVLQLLACGVYFGSRDDAWAFLQPLVQSDGATVEVDSVGGFSTLSTLLLDPQPDWPKPEVMPDESKQTRYVARNLQLAEWQALIDFLAASPPNQLYYFYLEIYGGSINAYPVENSAFIHRNAAFNACLDVFWYDGDDPGPPKRFQSDWCALMDPMWNGEIYQNYPAADVRDYRGSYWGKALDALVAVKAKYDPAGFFRFPQMVSPRTGGAVSRPVTWPPKVALALARPIVRTHDSPWPASGPRLPA